MTPNTRCVEATDDTTRTARNRLEPGTHKIYVEKKGFENIAKTVEMRHGKPMKHHANKI